MKNSFIISILIVLVILLMISNAIFVIALVGDGNFNIFNDKREFPFDYQWTTALCNGNECRDYLVTCKEGNVTDIEAISRLVTFPDSWEDPRDPIDNLCESR